MAPPHASSGKKWTRGVRIGKGVHATIFLATNSDNGKKLAVKSADRSNLMQRLALEVERRVLKACKSEYVVKYLGCDMTDRVKEMECQNTFNLLLELVPRGCILDHVHLNDDSLPEDIVAAYTHDILKGLSYLHSRGIVHGDVKAENCLIGKENIKLCDLGSGKFLADGDLPLEPKRGSNKKRIFTTGSRGWKAPEVQDETEQGPPSDIYSLGCTIVEMCTASPPCIVPSRVQHATGLPVLSSVIPANYSQQCRDFVDACLKRDPQERPNADELLKHVWFSKPCVYPIPQLNQPPPPSPGVFTLCRDICDCD